MFDYLKHQKDQSVESGSFEVLQNRFHVEIDYLKQGSDYFRGN